MTDLNNLHGTVTDGGGLRPFHNTAYANDANILTAALRDSDVGSGVLEHNLLKTDLGMAYLVGSMFLVAGAGPSGFDHTAVVWSVDSSSDGVSWTNRPITQSNSTVNINQATSTLTLITPVSARYWRLDSTVNTGGFLLTLWVNTWEINPSVNAEFVADVTTGAAPLLVTFTDQSTNSPTSWSWDFGDGGTSTSQNPSHTYTVVGTYTVALAATGPGGAITRTRVNYIVLDIVDVGHVPLEPAKALLEIYAAEPGSARWDEAHWDEDIWAESGWQDVTPEGIDATIRWGSHRPELGILSTPDAGSWGVTLYDPNGLLDPANLDGPYYGQLKPGLPIRVSHIDVGGFITTGYVVRQGIVESIGHTYNEPHTPDRGYIRATDKQALMVQAEVPPDSELSDTLFARARDAITAAGLQVTVLGDPPGGDPALVAWVTGTERTAWEWIADAALQVLWVPYVDRLGNLGFREWADPLVRGKGVDDTSLIGLQVISDYAGNYSVVQATDDADAVQERALTPTPAYGKRTYKRTDPTPNAEAWAQAVLEDRALPGTRWIPGQVFPLTSQAVRYWAAIEAVESIAIDHDTRSVDAVVVGGEITVVGKREDAATWRFTFEAAQAAEVPLIVSGSDPIEYLYASTGDVYLYRSR